MRLLEKIRDAWHRLTTTDHEPRPASTFRRYSDSCPHPTEHQSGVPGKPGLVKCELCGAIL